MSGATTRALAAVLVRAGRALPEERRDWVEALVAEAAAVPGRWRQVGWVLGGFAVLARELTREAATGPAGEVVRMRPWGPAGLVAAVLLVPVVLAPSVGPVPLAATVLALLALLGAAMWRRRRSARGPRPGPRPRRGRDRGTVLGTQVVVTAAVVAVAVLCAAVVRRYPEAASGAGAPLYGTLLALLLAAYLGLSATVAGADPVAARLALAAGLASAALWTAGTPGGSRWDVAPAGLEVLYDAGLVVALVAPPLLAAGYRLRLGGRVEHAVLAGVATGMVAALANLVAGLALVLAVPERVPLDAAALARHHTPAAILGANVGEDLVAYIGLLLVWPVAAGGLAAVLAALGTARRVPGAQPS